MIKVYTNGLYHYEISGEREKEAADEMERTLDFLSRSHLSGESYLLELSDAEQKVAKKYKVQIRTV